MCVQRVASFFRVCVNIVGGTRHAHDDMSFQGMFKAYVSFASERIECKMRFLLVRVRARADGGQVHYHSSRVGRQR